MARISRETPGAPWEKRGNAIWVECGSCSTWFPVSPVMARLESPPACCPRCHHEFKLAAGAAPMKEK